MMHLTFVKKMYDQLEASGLDGKSWEIRSLETVTSTNTKAEHLLELYNKVIVIAKYQTGGKGRKGRVWHSPTGGIWLSIGQNVEAPVRELSTPIVNCLQSVFSEYTSCTVKPPNDILIEGMKVCGVLVEAKTVDNQFNQVIVGVGVNVSNEIPEEIENIATRLEDHADIGDRYNLAAIIGKTVISTLRRELEMKEKI